MTGRASDPDRRYRRVMLEGSLNAGGAVRVVIHG
jgi:hypothetical protein